MRRGGEGITFLAKESEGLNTKRGPNRVNEY